VAADDQERRGRVGRKARRAAVGVGGLALGLGALTAALTPGRPAAQPSQVPSTEPAQAASAPGDPALIARGKHLADLGDCAACHTASGGQPFAGGQYMDMPFGTISTPNITPDKETGIGNYTDDQFVRVFHDGVNARGQNLYPAMPYPWYTKVHRDDVLAIKAYLFSLQPVHAPREPNHIYFPFTLRPLISVWNALFVTGGEFKPDPKQSDQVNQGDYIVNGLEHCGTCHNKRNLLGTVDLAAPLQGGVIDRWATPNITFDKNEGLGRYTDEQLVQYLKTGAVSGMGTAVGPMRETVGHSLSKLDDGEIRAMVAYLHTQSRSSGYQRGGAIDQSQSAMRGTNVYLSMCSSCHQPDGNGIKGQVPSLANNGMVIAAGPQSVIQVVLRGVEAHENYGPMPGLGVGMSDEQIADVTNYVRRAWGNGAPANADTAVVKLVREVSQTLMNGERPEGCPLVADEALWKAISDPNNGVTQMLHDMTTATMLPTVDKIIAKVKAVAPQAKQADIVNSLTIAYCPIVAQNDQISGDQKIWDLTHFSVRVYTQLTAGGKY
jgi:mono/diheme cytochrome c family protein